MPTIDCTLAAYGVTQSFRDICCRAWCQQRLSGHLFIPSQIHIQTASKAPDEPLHTGLC